MPALSDLKIQLIRLFEEWASETANSFSAINPAGSERKYFRVQSAHKTAIGVYHSNKKENTSFLSFSNTFQELKFNTPKIYATNLANDIYLIEDLGDQSLFSMIQEEGQNLSKNTINLIKKSLGALIDFQTIAVQHIDYSLCTPRPKLDRQSLLWDLNYFKYYFLKPQNIEFDEQKLEDDFDSFTQFLLQADQQYFVYRDFQSRNILIRKNEPYFIDYQGGRMGPLQYDVASFLFQVKANFNPELRQDLLNYYINLISRIPGIDVPKFKKYFYPYVLIRICQVLGAYGFRGIIERKTHFIQSIPYAVSALTWLMNHVDYTSEIPELWRSLKQVTKLEHKLPDPKTAKLSIHLNSFAYKAGIPIDYSGHGEGFVFDCRSLPNPGRLDQYRHLTGKDKTVQTYLEEQPSVTAFASRVLQIINSAIQEFKGRKFTDLCINFGCTGGQHRSVYMAELVYKNLKTDPELNIILRHTQKNNWITL